MKLKLVIAAVLVCAPAHAYALVDELDKPGETTLQTTQSGFDIRVQGADDPGNSVRVEIRPRNGNCVTSNNDHVTDSNPPPYNPQRIPAYTPPYLHDNPMCYDDRWGYFSADTFLDDYTSSYVIHGTLKSYKIEVTTGKDSTGKKIVTSLRTD